MSRLQALCPSCNEPVVIAATYLFLQDAESATQWPALETSKHAIEWHSYKDNQTSLEDCKSVGLYEQSARSFLQSYKCGHLFYRTQSPVTALTEPIRPVERTLRSLDGKKETRHYQIEGLDFIRQSGFNCLVADQQGLGKTIEALLTLREHQNELIPALVIVKGSTIWQWQRELKEWFDAVPNGVWMIRSGQSLIPPGFKVYLMSMDTLRAYVKVSGKATIKSTKKTSAYGSSVSSTSKIDYEVSPALLNIGFKFLIADEIHSFKNTDSKRSQALVELIRIAGIQRKVFLSGTPIKNRADEYFVPLNLLDPLNFPSMENFKMRFLQSNPVNGRYDRIAPWAIDRFKTTTAPYIIRRERNQVLKDLPKFSRTFEDVLIESETLKKLYNLELDKLQEKSDYKELTYNDIKDNLMTMRRIIGMAKAELIIDVIEEFLESSEDEKIVIGVHHHSVRDYLMASLAHHRPLSLSGDDNDDRKQRIIDAFRKPERRIAIFNIIAGGTGLNLQFCNNCIILERQWNSAEEEQFEDRFNRIGQTLPVTAAYPVAKRTIDEWFANMVEEKREIFGDTVAVDVREWTSNTYRDMIEWAMGSRL